jgi:hypothetical protein
VRGAPRTVSVCLSATAPTCGERRLPLDQVQRKVNRRGRRGGEWPAGEKSASRGRRVPPWRYGLPAARRTLSQKHPASRFSINFCRGGAHGRRGFAASIHSHGDERPLRQTVRCVTATSCCRDATSIRIAHGDVQAPTGKKQGVEGGVRRQISRIRRILSRLGAIDWATSIVARGDCCGVDPHEDAERRKAALLRGRLPQATWMC